VALMKLRERALGLRKGGTAEAGNDPSPDKLDVHHPVA
jgi:hypothetical protein